MARTRPNSSTRSRRRSSVLATLVVVAAAPSTTTALSLDGVTALITSPRATIGTFLSEHFAGNATLLALSSRKAAQLAACVWHGGGADARDDSSPAAPTALELSGRLDGEDTVRTYPAFPHAPVLVGVATCDRVELRWKRVDGAAWPVQRVVLERFPDLAHRAQWAPVAESGAAAHALADARVRPGRLYSYRARALGERNVSSAFAVEQVAVRASGACSVGGALRGLLAWRWSCEAARALALLVACFLSVFALVRARAARLLGARARSHRLKRIHQSAAAEEARAAPKHVVQNQSQTQTPSLNPPIKPPTRPAPLAARSSSDSSSSTASPTELLSQRSVESLSSVGTAPRESFERERESIGGSASACHNCQKRFGIFRRRRTCDVCRAVTLCRKCGYQAPLGFARASLSAAAAPDDAGGRRSSLSASRESLDGERAGAKIRTVCRSCCEDVYRYSTAGRPTLAQ